MSAESGHVVNCDHIIYSEWLRQSVLIFTNFDEAKAELQRFGAKCDCGTGGAGYAEHPEGDGLFWMIFRERKPGIPVIVHEAVHVVDYLLEFAGIPIEADNAEVRCYMTEWLVEELIKRFADE